LKVIKAIIIIERVWPNLWWRKFWSCHMRKPNCLKAEGFSGPPWASRLAKGAPMMPSGASPAADDAPKWFLVFGLLWCHTASNPITVGTHTSGAQ